MYPYTRPPVSKIATVVLVGVIAAGIGFVMQRGSSQRLGAIYSDAAIAQPNDVGSAVLTKSEMDQPTQLDKSIQGIQLTSSAGWDDTNLKPNDDVQKVVDCTPDVTAQATATAMIALDISAPCFAHNRVSILHDGLNFTIASDENGMVHTMVPALSKDALVIVTFSSGTSVVVQAEVPAIEKFDRVVLQWEGETGLQLHAFENDAAFNAPGHVWSEQPGNMESMQKGFLLQLGDPKVASPKLAEVYTFPTGYVTQENHIKFSADAEVNRYNCLREISAQTLHYSPETGVDVVDFLLPIPDCQTIGGYMMLNNIVEDLKIASIQ